MPAMRRYSFYFMDPGVVVLAVLLVGSPSLIAVATAASPIPSSAPNHAVPLPSTNHTPPASSGSAPRSISPSSKANVTKAAFDEWKTKLLSRPLLDTGCFVANYPNYTWQPTKCVEAPARPYAPRSAPLAIQPSKVGNKNDWIAQSPPGTIISQTVGSLSVSGLTSETGSGNSNCSPPDGPDCYSLQINTNIDFGPVTTAYTNNRATLAWEQFIFSNTGTIFIQFWLRNYASSYGSCPPNWVGLTPWHIYGNDCWANSPATSRPRRAATALDNLSLIAQANFLGSGNDVVILCDSAYGCGYSSTSDNVLNLSQDSNWLDSEFNVFGDSGGAQANFNAGTSITVSIELKDQSGGILTPVSPCPTPTWGTTAETNNLNLVHDTCSSWLDLSFLENNFPEQLLTTDVSPAGSGSVYPYLPGGAYAMPGQPFSITATPAAGMVFQKWVVTGAFCSGMYGDTSNPCTFTMPANPVSAIANFMPPPTSPLTTGVDSGAGSVDPNCPSGQWCLLVVGSTVNVTAYPATPDWVFSGWVSEAYGTPCSGGPSSNPCTFTMPNYGASLFAIFTLARFDVTFQQVGIPDGFTWGVTVPSPGGTRYTSSKSYVTVSVWPSDYVVGYSYDASVQAPNGASFACTSGCHSSVTGPDTVYASYTSIPPYSSPYSVTFQQAGIPGGVTWGVAVGEQATPGLLTTYVSSNTKTVSGLSGLVTYSYDSSVHAPGGGSYTCFSGCAGYVTGANTVEATYTFSPVMPPLGPPPLTYDPNTSWWLGPLATLAVLVDLVILVVLVVLVVLGLYYLLSGQRRQGASVGYAESDAFRILKERYARGEITSEQYAKIKRDLKS